MRRTALVLAVIALALPAATSAPAASRDSNVNLVAYSTPREAFAEDHPRLPGDTGRQGRLLHAVLRRVRGAGAGGRSPANPPTSSTSRSSRTWTAGRRPGWSRRTGSERVQGHRHPFGRRVRRAQRQPEAHPGLGRPRQAGRQVLTPNPFTSGGARWNIMAAYGAHEAQGQDATQQAAQYLDTLFHHVVVQDKSARDALQTFLAGKGDVLLTYENEAKLALAARAARVLRHPEGDDAASTTRSQCSRARRTRRAAQAFVKFLYTPAAQKLFAEGGLPARELQSVVRGQLVPGARRSCSRSTTLGGWDRSTQQLLRSQHGDHGEDREAAWRLSRPAARAARAAPPRCGDASPARHRSPDT